MKILITGGISGLGYGVAKELALKGHIVYLGVRTLKEEEYLNEKLKREKLRMFPVVLDLTTDNYTIPNDIDILYLNASIGKGGSILELNSNYLTDTFNVNILGNIKLIKKYYQAKDNSIYINDINLNSVTKSSIDSKIVYISQNEMLFTDTLINNIKFSILIPIILN